MGIDTRLAVEDDDAVSEIGGHDEIVLDDEGRLLGVHDEPLDDAAGHDTLFGIEICTDVSKCTENVSCCSWRLTRRRLVDEVDIGGHAKGQDNGDLFRVSKHVRAFAGVG
jgi:hypothetical protein